MEKKDVLKDLFGPEEEVASSHRLGSHQSDFGFYPEILDAVLQTEAEAENPADRGAEA